MYCQCFLRTKHVYVPTTGVTKHKLYRVIEPVAVIAVWDTAALHQALIEAMVRGNPEVTALPPSDYPPPVLPKYAGVKSWNTFARNASLWAISEQNGAYKIVCYRKDRPGAWVEDRARDIIFPANTSADGVIERLVAVIQNAAEN
jgi:hypothetical protein